MGQDNTNKETLNSYHEWLKAKFDVVTTALEVDEQKKKLIIKELKSYGIAMTPEEEERLMGEIKPLTNIQAEDYFMNIRHFFAEQYHWELREPNDPDIEAMSMGEFIYYKMRH